MSKFRFNQKAAKVKAMKGQLLDRMANNAVTEFKVNAFDRRGLDGKSWAPNKKQVVGRQQLVNTSRMRSSIRTLKSTTDSRTVGSDVPYAAYHNNGAKHLPQRKFIGKSRAMEAKNKQLIFDTLTKIV